MLTDGVWARVEVGGEHLRLFSEHNAQGIQASVYNVKTKTWIAPSDPVDDIEQGKDRAAELAQACLNRVRQGHYRGPFHGVPIAYKDLPASQLAILRRPLALCGHRSYY